MPVPETKVREIKGLQFRAKLPQYVRYAAAALFSVALIVVVVGFYRSRPAEFRMKGFPTSLSKDVVATVEGYERRETEDGEVKYYIKADKATTFADNHQELENVFLQVFENGGDSFDQITAAKAVYVPEQDKNFTAYFAGAVAIQTRDSLFVNTEQITYKKADETVTVEEPISFRRETIRGTAVGAVVRMAERQLQLLRDVRIDSFESADSDVRRATMSAGAAAYDQQSERITLESGIEASVFSHAGNARQIDVSGTRGTVFMFVADSQPDVTKLELFDNVRIVSSEPNSRPTKISSGYALYEKPSDRFELKRGVEINTVEDEKPTIIKSAEAVYEQKKGRILVNGSGEIAHGDDLVKGDAIEAFLYPDRKLRSASSTGNAFLRQVTAERTTEVSAPQLNISYAAQQVVTAANAIGLSTVVMNPANAQDYSRVTMTAPSAIRLKFNTGLLADVVTEGRTTIALDAAGGNADAANKKLTADAVNTHFAADGRNIMKAEAVGNAELIVDPVQATNTNYLTKVNAPRFDCEFFPTGNNARMCTASTKTKTERTPKTAGRSTQFLSADKLNVTFNPGTRDVEIFEANGSAKFTEADRNAIAGRIVFGNADGRVLLRGGEPTVWDSSARAKAAEIDWDTRAQKSTLRGGVSTTYYSQKKTGSAAPFDGAEKPVFITAAGAEIDHRNESAVYSGNARGWQENNFVRGDMISIFQREGTFFANGSVQSLLYNAKRKENGRESTVPVYASSQKLSYNRDSRVLRYEDNVDIKQGSDRITGGVANVQLTAANEVARTDVERNVVITQPNRRATADFASYDQSSESVVLKGNPATVNDAESGSSQGGQLTVYLKNNRVEAEGRSRQNSAGRTRSVYKIKGN